MKVQYVLYKTELDAKGKEVEIYLTPSGGASANHEEAKARSARTSSPTSASTLPSRRRRTSASTTTCSWRSPP